MYKMSAREIAEVVSGELINGLDPAAEVTAIAQIDSRLVKPGDLFVAIEGKQVDGHDYAEAAQNNGSVFALVQKQIDTPAIKVAYVQKALDLLATHQALKAKAHGLKVVAVTGSSGKTSTKDIIAQILKLHAQTLAPIGSRNNELGVPLTVLELKPEHKYLVVEMGADAIGDITHLTQIVQPDISIVLNVGSAHLGHYGGVENIQKAKSEIVMALDESGVAILNLDDQRVKAMASLSKAPVKYYSTQVLSDASATNIDLGSQANPIFTLVLDNQEAQIELNFLGEHYISNALAAASAAASLEIPFARIVAGLNMAKPLSPGRMQETKLPENITIINDAYNANPESMKASLKALAHIGRINQQRTIAVLGQMLELGENSVLAHDEIGRLAVRLNISRLIVVGEGAKAIHNGASLEGSFGNESEYVPNLEEAKTLLESTLKPGDVALFKSSNSAGLARLGEYFAANWNRS